jgi:hypothetical protein
MECDMAKKPKPGGKRRRWAPIRQHTRPPEWILPPQFWSALGATFVDERWCEAAAQALARLKARHDAGDGRALFEALDLNTSIMVPWIAEAYAKGWGRYLRHEAKTLDEAFGVERPKGQHFEAARKRERLRPQIILGVYALHANGKGMPLDGAIFETIGREAGISGREASEIFGEPESDELRELARNLRISNMFEID